MLATNIRSISGKRWMISVFMSISSPFVPVRHRLFSLLRGAACRRVFSVLPKGRPGEGEMGGRARRSKCRKIKTVLAGVKVTG